MKDWWTKWRDAMLLIPVLRQGFSGIRKAVYSSVKCFVNCVLNTKWAVSICKGRWSHKNKLFLNSYAWPGNGLIRENKSVAFAFLFSVVSQEWMHAARSLQAHTLKVRNISYDTDLSCILIRFNFIVIPR